MRHRGKHGAKAGGETAAPEFELTRSTYFDPRCAEGPLDLLDMCVAALQDKHCSTRQAAMTALGGALEGLLPLDELDSRCLTIFVLCGVSIKKCATSPREARLAYRAVGLLALTLGAGASDLLDQAFPLLSRTLQAQAARGDGATVAAVTFAGAQGVEEAERSLRAIWAVISPPSSRSSKLSGARKTSPQVVAAAVSAWTFFVTTVAVTDAQRKADRAGWNAAVASLAGLLEDDDRAVRIAAGEALAVCVELNLTQYAPGKDMEAVAARVSDLAAEAGGRGVDKKLLPEQKELFRRIAAFLDHDERPREALRTSSDRRVVLRVSTWAKLVQLNFLRRFLGGGFLRHVQGNALFKEAFSFGADESKMLSIARKRQSSKTKEMKVNRDRTWEWRHFFYHYYRRYPELRDNPERLLQIGWH